MLNRSRPREAIVSVVYEVQTMGDDEIPAHFIHDSETGYDVIEVNVFHLTQQRFYFEKRDNSVPIPLPKDTTSFLSFKSVSSLCIFFRVKVLSCALSVLLIFALNVSGKHDTLPARLVPFFELALPF